MKSFRNPKYLERYEDVVYDLEQALDTAPANNAHQTKTGLRFVADNTGETTPFDWYNARLSMDFKVNMLADGANLAANDHNGIVNGSNSFIKKLSILANGREVYSCNYANRVVNIKNLLEYNPSYAQSVATNEFYFLDTSRAAEERSAQATYNKGFAARKALLGVSATVNCEIPLNRYSFFEALEDKLLPNTKIELNIEIEKDANLIFQAADNCRVIITRLQLFIPKLTFNSEGQKLYMENYLKPYKWIYLNEVIEGQIIHSNRQDILKLQMLFQNHDMYLFLELIQLQLIHKQQIHLYDTFDLPNNADMSRCYLEVANGNEYPDIHFKPSTDISRVFRNVLSYVYANNDYQGGTLLNRSNFETLFPFVYFDLTKQKMDIKDGVTKLAFHYELTANPNADYNIYALVLHERVAEISQQDGKLLLPA